jgi:hypothetical protein
MGIATHLGPWVLGTVKNTSGTTAGLIRNTGATMVIQTASLAIANGASTVATFTLGVLPAGAVIHAIIQDVTAAVTSASGTNTITYQTGNATTGLSTNFAAASALGTSSGTSSIAVGRSTITPDTTRLPLFANTGTTDLIIQVAVSLGAAVSQAGAVNFQLVYAVRNADGTAAPSVTTGP